MTEEDEKLPFGGHIVCLLQHFYFVEGLILVVFMWAEEVVVCNPKSQIIVGTVDVVKVICMEVRSFIGKVETFNYL